MSSYVVSMYQTFMDDRKSAFRAITGKVKATLEQMVASMPRAEAALFDEKNK